MERAFFLEEEEGWFLRTQRASRAFGKEDTLGGVVWEFSFGAFFIIVVFIPVLSCPVFELGCRNSRIKLVLGGDSV